MGVCGEPLESVSNLRESCKGNNGGPLARRRRRFVEKPAEPWVTGSMLGLGVERSACGREAPMFR